MWKHTSPRVEGVVDGVFVKVGETRRVDVSKSKESPGEVRWVVVSPEDAAKLCIKHSLRLLSVEGSATLGSVCHFVNNISQYSGQQIQKTELRNIN